MTYRDLLLSRGATPDEADQLIAAVNASWPLSFDSVMRAVIDMLYPVTEHLVQVMMQLAQFSYDEVYFVPERRKKPNTPYRQWTRFAMVRNTRHYRRGAYV